MAVFSVALSAERLIPDFFCATQFRGEVGRPILTACSSVFGGFAPLNLGGSTVGTSRICMGLLS